MQYNVMSFDMTLYCVLVFIELALQNVSMILRSEQEHMEVVEELHEIGEYKMCL